MSGRSRIRAALPAARSGALAVLSAAIAGAGLVGIARGAPSKPPVVGPARGRPPSQSAKRAPGAGAKVGAGAAKGAGPFLSAPAIDPPPLSIAIGRDAASGSASGAQGAGTPEYIFLAPHNDFADQEPFVGAAGPEIVEPDGRVVWQLPMRSDKVIDGRPAQLSANDFTTATYRGEPVLVWWEGYMNPEATIGGIWVIANRHYQRIATIRPPRGLQLDLHDIQITPNGMAYVIASRTVSMNLRGCCRGPVHGQIYDQEILEIDISTGRVVWSWDALAHIPLRESYQRVALRRPWFPYHLNSIAIGPSGNLIVSARNTWAAYWIKRVGRRDNGAILATLGGRRSTFRLGPGARFAWQHDVRPHGSGEVSLFDDEAAPVEGRQSRGLMLALDWSRHTATVVHQYLLPRPQLAGSQGNVEIEPDGNVFVGWGQLPYFTEYSASGRLLYEGVLPGPDGSYRAFRAPWVGLPSSRPAAVARHLGKGGGVDVYVSWNGATQVASWQLLAGPSAGRLQASGHPVPRQGFQTTIATTGTARYYAVQALGSAGEVLGQSKPIRATGAAARR